MKSLLIALLAGSLALPLSAAPQNEPNFSGTWDMDASRSESAHQDVPIGPVSLVIRQTAEQCSIETRRSETNSAAVSKETLTFRLNGTDMTNDADSATPIKAKAHWDGNKLVVETAREINGSTVTTMQVFELNEDGKEITIQKTLSVQHGYQGPGAQRPTGIGKDVFVKTAGSK